MLINLALAVFWAVCFACAVMHYRETRRIKREWKPAKAEYLGPVLSNASLGDGLSTVLYSPQEYRYEFNGIHQTIIDEVDSEPFFPENAIVYINPDDLSEIEPPSWRRHELLSIVAIAALVPAGILIFGSLLGFIE